MRVLLVHNESVYFAGAQRMLNYFLEGIRGTAVEATVAFVETAQTRAMIPDEVPLIRLPPSPQLDPRTLARQTRMLLAAGRSQPFDLIHGWTARDWELTALAALLLRKPAVGTLHDHPEAEFISPKRRRLMRWAARWGMSRIICVSQAVREACVKAGYPEARLRVAHNGLPEIEAGPALRSAGTKQPFRLGFLGVFSERKGLSVLFEVVDRFARALGAQGLEWELQMAGGAQDEAGKALVATMQARYSQSPWWPRVQWLGWVQKPREFVAGLDLLICPSKQFDPFPTVLLEAGWAGVPTLASRLGGAGEIIAEGETGWTFDPEDPGSGAARLREAALDVAANRRRGENARARMKACFGVETMVANYQRIYGEL